MARQSFDRPTTEEVFGPTKGDPTEQYLEVLRWAEKDKDFGRHFAEKLGKNQNPAQAFPHINRLVHDPSPEIRRLGLIALAHCHAFGHADAGKVVARLMVDPDEGTRVALAEGLSHADVYYHKVCDEVEALTRDPSPRVRAAIAGGLYCCGKEKCDRALARLLVDRDSAVREAAAYYLPNFEERETNYLLPEDILPCVKDNSPEVRALVCPWLATQPVEMALPNLLALSKDLILSVRQSALSSLSHLDHPVAVQTLLAALKDKLGGIREVATEGLRGKPGQEIGRALMALASDPVARVRRHVAQGLVGRAEVNMLPVLKKLADDQADANTRFQAAKAVATLPGGCSEEILAGLLGDPVAKVRNLAKRLLLERGRETQLSPSIAYDVKYGFEAVASCRQAFLMPGGNGGGVEAWKKFLGKVMPFDVVAAVSSDTVPSVVFLTKTGGTAALMAGGPAHWIAIAAQALTSGVKGRRRSPRVDCRILSQEGVSSWIASQGIVQVYKGVALARAFGWIGDQELEGASRSEG